MTIAEACELATVSRAGFYRNYQEHEPRQADIKLRDRLQRLALQDSKYGYRRLRPGVAAPRMSGERQAGAAADAVG